MEVEDTELDALLREVESYLKASGMKATAFGLQAVHDGALLGRMRGGAGLTTRKVSAIRRFMKDNPPIPEEQRGQAPKGKTESWPARLLRNLSSP